jgi:tRNA A-37 threonylcarbamoyl transferase component Bud32
MTRHFQILKVEDLSRLTAGASILEQDRFGIKVIRLHNGTILKIFRIKRWFSSAVLYPYSLRFFRNAQKLSYLGVPTLEPVALFRLPEKWRTAVHYEPLLGRTLRQVIEQGNGNGLTLALGHFVAELHEKGIYFRSLHLGNIILTPDGKLGLIDVADTKFYKSRLSRRHRIRNLMHLCRVQADRTKLEGLGWRSFCEGYLSACRVERLCNESFRSRIYTLIG